MFHSLLIFISCFFFFQQTEASNKELVLIGDMWVHPDDILSSEFSTRGHKLKTTRLWPNGVLPLAFHPNVSSSRQKQFMKWCEELGDYADIQCRKAVQSDRDYIVVQMTKKNICGSSHLGRTGGDQPLKMGCWRKRTALHELMHALGLPHEHNRPDRDEYIRMLWENLKLTSRRNYAKVRVSSVGFLSGFYDYDSIMHYESRAGSKNGKHVFYRLDTERPTGLSLSRKMSYGDHYSLVKLYGGVEP